MVVMVVLFFQVSQTWGDYKVHVIDYDYDYLRIS